MTSRLELPDLSPERHVFLSGPMGAGKSTVGAALAERLGLPFVDLDRGVEARAGKSVAAIFTENGEPTFRALERELAAELAQRKSPIVAALGGGTVADEATRRALLTHGRIITLSAPSATLAARVAHTARPLLRGEEPAAVLERLGTRRASAYAEAHVVLDADAAPEIVLARLEAALAARPIVVALGERSYRARFGALTALAQEVRCPRALIVADAHTESFARLLQASLAQVATSLIVLTPGEAYKNVATLESLWQAARAAGLDRGDFILAVGGGVVGDLAGLAAATWMRGVRWGVVPTTLLSMADSAIGGKTAIDLGPSKNLVGAFHQPRFVHLDVSTLDTLPTRERRAGLAEIVKAAWLAGSDAVAQLETSAEMLAAGDRAATERAVELALRVKARIVAADETETGPRRALNLGHTLGHAFESAGFEQQQGLLHGEAVALGLVAAHALAQGRRIGPGPARVRALLERLGLPVDLGPWLGRSDLEAHLGHDKKKQGDTIRCILPGEPGEIWTEALTPAEILAGAREFGF